MPTYAYRAIEDGGQLVSGALTAENHQVALRMLDEKALHPVSVDDNGKLGADFKWCHSKIESGIKAFVDLADREPNRGRVPDLKEIIAEHQEIESKPATPKPKPKAKRPTGDEENLQLFT